MKKLMLALAVLGALALPALAQETMYIGVQTAPIRANPTPFAPVVATLAHGDAVTVVARQTGWLQVQSAAGAKGWANQSLFQKDRVVLTAGASDANTGASAREQGAAAKGFSPQVEQQYVNQNPDLTKAYAVIDRMEAARASEADVMKFLREGGLL
ncbi:MAG TPA: SH3 domain-containing protein [Kiritimatiellia bacterium]|nr:SH3 domain-containing protein [Kiritimatiellia bacterium]